jgi:hypothetical protein
MIFIGLSVVAAQVGIRSLGQVIECGKRWASRQHQVFIQSNLVLLHSMQRIKKAERSTQFRGQKPMNIKWWDQNISWPK